MDTDKFALANRARTESRLGYGHALDAWSLSDWMVSLAGEVGEACNVVKKLNRLRDGLTIDGPSEDEFLSSLVDELADVYIYLDLVFQSLGLALGWSVERKFDRTSQQIGYPVRLIH